MRREARAESLTVRSMESSRMRLRMFYMGPVTPQDEIRWRTALGRLGTQRVIARLAQLTSLDQTEMVETWLRRKKQKKRRFCIVAVLAFAAIVATIPAMIGWW